MKSDQEPSSDAATTAMLLDSVLDTMTALAAETGRLEQTIHAERLRDPQRQHDLATELSGLGLTLAEAYRRIRRCHDLCKDED